ncbi:MAG: phosphohistidine phosphatase SixA [Desulfarculaceae bacterium]|jgi:phosphohistidine phosphatase
MEIYLMQHGPQLPSDQDPEEGLSPQGEAIVKDSAAALAKMGIAFDAVITSPKKRAQQTAELVCAATGFTLEQIVISEKAKAMASPDETLEMLGAYQDRNRVLLAGHLPNLALVASGLLIGGPGAELLFERGCICCIEVQDFQAGPGRLRWFLLPGHLKKIAA